MTADRLLSDVSALVDVEVRAFLTEEGKRPGRLTPRAVLALRRVKVLGCGSAHYAGLYGAGVVESLARIPADAEPASEFRYRNPIVERDTLYVADTENHVIRGIDLETGIIRTVLGTGQRGDGPDGDASRCALARPHGVFVDRRGVLYVGDSEAHRIRTMTL